MKYLLSLFLLLILALNSNAQELEAPLEYICIFPDQPKFPGGMVSLNAFISSHFQWRQEQTTVAGRVFVQFTVNEDGSVSDATVIKGLCQTCDKEALRLIRMLPNWKPATKDGCHVNRK